jgi:hypothetical protein
MEVGLEVVATVEVDPQARGVDAPQDERRESVPHGHDCEGCDRRRG